jgi:hypothetical protein
MSIEQLWLRERRRRVLTGGLGGLGGIALSTLLGARARAAAVGPAGAAASGRAQAESSGPHHRATAKAVIFIYLGGGPSHIDLLDPKPALQKYDGKAAPQAIVSRRGTGATKLLASRYRFANHGASGLPVSELLPHLARRADDLAVVRSMWTTRIDHDEARVLFCTGRAFAGFPSLGSWCVYGLGTENRNLPAFISIPDTVLIKGHAPSTWTSGFLPATYQATPLNDSGPPIHNLVRPAHVSPRAQRRYLDLVQTFNRGHSRARPGATELDARIANLELAARMQVEAMRHLDLRGESAETRALYGADQESTRTWGRMCLLARRLVEGGVRFVQLVSTSWDHHGNIWKGLPQECLRTDQPIAALLSDLKRRGLLDSTLVVWSGEFGRLPTAEGQNADALGRDHDMFGFSMWMAGGGIKGGTAYGATDEIGYAAVEDRVSIADVHATILHCLGLEARRLTFDFEGRDETLLGVERARVIRELLG